MRAQNCLDPDRKLVFCDGCERVEKVCIRQKHESKATTNNYPFLNGSKQNEHKKQPLNNSNVMCGTTAAGAGVVCVCVSGNDRALICDQESGI